MRKILPATFLALVLPGLVHATPAVKVPVQEEAVVDVGALVAKIQNFYEKTDGLDTRFQQQFQQGGIPSRLGGAGAEGRLRFRKPQGQSGPMMRWDYDDGRVLLLSGETSYTFDPDTKQVTSYQLDVQSLSAALTFLWGKGKLVEDFDIALAKRKDLGSEGVVLELTPKKASSFLKVFLVADPETGLVRRSVVVQGGGSENRLTFVEPKTGAVAPLSEFDPASAFPKDAVRVDSKLR